MSYTTLEDVKAELNITDSTVDDALIAEYIATAQRTLEAPMPRGTGRVFEMSADTTRYLDVPIGTDDDWFLPFWDVGDICSITSVTNGDSVVIPSTAYVTFPRYKTPYYGIRLKPLAGYLWTYSGSPEGAIAIAGKWSYSATCPADISRAALRLAVAQYRAKDNAGANDTPIQTDQGIILPVSMPKDVQDIIKSYQSLV